MDRMRTSERAPQVDQPGLGELRTAVANRVESPRRDGSLRQNALAGLNAALNDLPDGMAAAVLAGVNPIYGLYASIVGPIAGGLFTSTRLMVISTTSAASLAAGQALGSFSGGTRDQALFFMVLVVGVVQILCGLLRLGWLTRFVSYSVMTGLLAGIAVLIVLSQLPTVTGYAAARHDTVAGTLDLLAHLDEISPPSLGLALLAMALALLLPRTRLGHFGLFMAIVLPSLLAGLFALDGVQTIGDLGEIPRGLPMPTLPSFGALSDVSTGALAVATIILVQGAGVSQSVPNPNGSRSSASRDFIAQGIANVACGLFRGLPVGGSMGATALSVVSGAGTRWASILSGIWVAAIVLLFPNLVSHIAMPTLGALLIVASIKTIKPMEVRSVWQTGWPSRLASATTFVSTLLLQIQAAVGIGVALSVLIYLSESSADVSVVELVERPDGRMEERKLSKRLRTDTVTVLDVYGHLFFAGARTLERLLPTPEGTRNVVVILRLRGHAAVGATLIEVLSDYAELLRGANGRLYLTGLGEEAYEQVQRSDKLRLSGPVRAYEVTPILGQSTRKAYTDAQTWLVERKREASHAHESQEI